MICVQNSNDSVGQWKAEGDFFVQRAKGNSAPLLIGINQSDSSEEVVWDLPHSISSQIRQPRTPRLDVGFCILEVGMRRTQNFFEDLKMVIDNLPCLQNSIRGLIVRKYTTWFFCFERNNGELITKVISFNISSLRQQQTVILTGR